jgi:hypothetical protein
LALPPVIVRLACVAVILNTKPRARLPSGELPEVKTARSRSWLPYSIALWVVAVVVGHGILYEWLPFLSHRTGATPDVSATSSSDPGSSLAARAQRPAETAPLVPTAASTSPPERSSAVDTSKLPSCESVKVESQEPTEQGSVLPVDLSRTPLGNLLDYRSWTKRCRGPKATRVHLCLAVKNGNVLGATARAEPSDSAVERCIVRAALLVSLEPEDFVRKVQLDIDVPAERAR